jgi:Flp pilus assembly protein TadD
MPMRCMTRQERWLAGTVMETTADRPSCVKPAEAEAYNTRARAYLKLGQRDLALRDYALARRIRWYDPDPH